MNWRVVFCIAAMNYAGGAVSAQKLDFNRDVRPILSDKCFACHGPDASQRQADLRLDRRQAAIDAGAIVPGAADRGGLIERVFSDDDELRMPPPEAPKQLTDDERQVLRSWIEQGAAYATHWAFEPPVQSPPPEHSPSASNAIDAFILARLQKAGLTPSPSADAITLVRRAYLDVLGLPPDPQDADAWVQRLQTDDGAGVDPVQWGVFVDQLLASQHYGERWGQLWLDAARYADSDGFEKDKPRFVWAYRDWVIQSLNRDLPYDQFLIHQIAGDMLANKGPSAEGGSAEDQVIATGYLRNSMINEEGGIDPEQFRMEAMFDRMDAIGKGVLGLTIQCAQCHTHKFDPLTQREYYQMFAFLNNCHEANVAAYTNNERQQRDRLLDEIRSIELSLQKANPDWREQMHAWETEATDSQVAWRILRPEEDASGGQKHYVLDDHSVLAAGYAPTRHETAFDVNASATRITAIRLELLNDPNLPRGGPGRSIHGLCALTEFKLSAAPIDDPAQAKNVEFASATASVNPAVTPLDTIFDDRSKKKRVTGPIEMALDGKDETAWGIDRGPGRSNVPEEAVFVLKQPLEQENGVRLTLRLRQMHGGWNSDDNQNNNLGRFRFSYTDAEQPQADPVPVAVRDILRIPSAQRSNAQQGTVFSYWRTLVPQWSEANQQIENLWRQHPRGATQLVLQRREPPRETSVLARGDFLKPIEPVTPGVPAFLHDLETSRGDPSEQAPTRLDFARWLASDRSPTTARAIVNRIWQAYFGAGLVQTPEDLGAQSPPPSHPELLDWLAVEFMRSGWKLKELSRWILTSNVYRQSSRFSAPPASVSHEEPKLASGASTSNPPAVDPRQVDPTNRLLWRYPRRRVDAESVRDIALAASGLLDRRLGGPSVHPPAPDFLFQPPASYGPKTWNESNRRGSLSAVHVHLSLSLGAVSHVAKL